MIHAINESAYAVMIRESQFIYPLLQVVHLLGVGLFVGGVLFGNLRVAGVGRVVPLYDFVRYASRIALAGLVLILFAGLQIGASFIEVFYVSGVMRVKMLVLLVALANFAWLWINVSGARPRWASTPPSRGGAALWMVAGIAALPALITLGKLLAYIGGKD